MNKCFFNIQGVALVGYINPFYVIEQYDDISSIQKCHHRPKYLQEGCILMRDVCLVVTFLPLLGTEFALGYTV